MLQWKPLAAQELTVFIIKLNEEAGLLDTAEQGSGLGNIGKGEASGCSHVWEETVVDTFYTFN